MHDFDLAPTDLAQNLTRWLRAQRLSTPKNLIKLRLLGNHDTVTWVFQQARAVNVYGVKKAKALWVLISCIDGIPMIYQGDEDPALLNDDGPSLKSFFRELFHTKKKWLGNHMETEYLFTNTPIIAFIRRHEQTTRLVLINLSDQTERCHLDYQPRETLFGQCFINGSAFQLDAYGYAVLDV